MLRSTLRCYLRSLVKPRQAIPQPLTRRSYSSAQHAFKPTISAPLSSPEVDTLFSTPNWSINTLLPSPKPSRTAPNAVTPAKLRHLLRLSALPQPTSELEEKTMLEQLQQQLHFVRQVQGVDVQGVEPMVRVRDETSAADKERKMDSESMKEVLGKEKWVGRWVRRVRRPNETNFKRESENWDVLGQAPKRVGGYFIVEGDTGKSGNG